METTRLHYIFKSHKDFMHTLYINSKIQNEQNELHTKLVSEQKSFSS